MRSIVTWTTYSVPTSLVNVGGLAICTRCDNILVFTDLKTQAVTYYKAESPEQGLSLSAIAGHYRFPFVAFTEVVLRPSVHILEYPSLEKYAVFKNTNVICFVDVKFNDADLIIALGGFPNYIITIWNFRTGQLMLEKETNKPSIAPSLLLSYKNMPQIVQYSEWTRYLMIWEICYAATGADLHKVSRFTLDNEYALCNTFSMCYLEDNNLYIVNNFGVVSLIQIAQFNLDAIWSRETPKLNAQRYKLYGYKQGLLVYCKDAIYFIQKQYNLWRTEWYLDNNMPKGGIINMVSNMTGDIFATADIGNLYQINPTNDSASFKVFYGYNKKCIGFAILKGVNEECMLQLTFEGTLRAVDMAKIHVYSELKIPDGSSIAASEAAPYVIVGTTTGKLHFFNYKSIEEPIEVGSIQTEYEYAINAIQFMDNLVAYRNIYYNFFFVHVDFARRKFYELSHIVRIPESIQAYSYFLNKLKTMFIFLTQDQTEELPHVTELWSFKWSAEQKSVTCNKYRLPHKYRVVILMHVPARDADEFIGARFGSNIIDVLHLGRMTHELQLVSTIRTNHLANITGIVGSKHLLTWALDGTLKHFRSHKKSTKQYVVNQQLQIKYLPRVVNTIMDCFNGKYLVYKYSSGGIKIMQIKMVDMPLLENTILSSEETDNIIIEPYDTSVKISTSMGDDEVIEHTPEEFEARDKLLAKIESFSQEVSALIDYDINVTGKTHGAYKKFCLNHIWLQKVTKEAKYLCDIEKKSLETAINDQARVRDWIRNLIMANSENITYKVRAIFSNFSFENYGRRRKNDSFSEFFDLYRFYNMADEENEIQEGDEESDNEEGSKHEETGKRRKYLDVRGSAFDHILSDELALQDINTVTANQMYNHDAKFRILLTDRLKEEFNQKFEVTRKIKIDLMNAILGTNASLDKIYANMNCMLCLLKMETFKAPVLSVPLWKNDEFIERIMEVDDSEIKAINRRKKKAEVKADKAGRLLLWSIEFWVRSLVVMMDGVLEKLWEEEIKKEIPVPECMLKKEATEYTLEDQKAVKDYEQRYLKLIEDRKKYLRILAEQDININDLKEKYILKLNDQITLMMIEKLKYDFCVKHARLRNLNTKIMFRNRMQWLGRIKILRADIDKFSDYINRYGKLLNFWNKSVEDLTAKVETITSRDRNIERQFRTIFFSALPQHMMPEMNKIFKRRPKLSPKISLSPLLCTELSARVNSKGPPKYPFPVPKDIFEYLDALKALDDPASMMPGNIDFKQWDQFVKQRRQKIEMELKLRATNLNLAAAVTGVNYFNKELQNLKGSKTEYTKQLFDAQVDYVKEMHNQTLELRLTMGQVELNVMGSLSVLDNCLLMHIDDINDINALILKVGAMKLKAMHRVAFFRRQVVFKEWEHKVISANIEYLQFMLHVIEKLKINMEFLNVLRNWSRVRAEKQKMLNTVGLIERTIEDKQISYRRQLDRLNMKISKTRQQVDDMKRSNKILNRQIEEVKVNVAFCTTKRDFLAEDKKMRDQKERMEKHKKRTQLVDTVRRDYAHILELKALLELQRLRTYPTLGPNPDHCML